MFNSKNLKQTAKIFCYSVVAVQTLLMLVWLFFNLTDLTMEKMFADYLTASKSHITDGYMSMLYALVVGLISRLAGDGAGLYAAMYILQAAAVFLSFFSFPISKKEKLLAGLFVISNPLVVGGIRSLLPEAFALASAVASVGFLLSWFKEKKISFLAGYFAGLLLLGLFCRDYGIISLVILLPILLFSIKKYKKSLLLPIGALILATVISFMVNSLATTEYSYHRGERSLELLLLQRFPGDKIYLHTQDLAEFYDFDAYYVLSNYERHNELLFESFSYDFEKRFGREKAKAFYNYMIDRAVEKGLKATSLEICKSALAYTFPYVAVPIAYYGKLSRTHLPWLISTFTRNAPELSRMYYCFGIVASLIVILLGGISVFAEKNVKAAIKTFVIIAICFALGIYLSVFALKGFDYRFSMISNIIIPIWGIHYFVKEN